MASNGGAVIKKLIMISFLLSNTLVASEIDYSLCIEFLHNKKLDTFLVMDEKGKLSPRDTAFINKYQEEDGGRKITLTWGRSTYHNKKNNDGYLGDDYTIKVSSQISDSGEVKIYHERLDARRMMTGASITNSFFGRKDWSGSKTVPYFDEKTIVSLAIKNGKCYPHELKIDKKSVKGLFNKGDEESRVVSSEKCRSIVDFYKRHSNLRKCSDTSALKQLQEILGPTGKKWEASNKLLSNIEADFAEALKIFDIATDELKECDSYGLSKTVESDELWQQSQSSKSTISSTVHER